MQWCAFRYTLAQCEEFRVADAKTWPMKPKPTALPLVIRPFADLLTFLAGKLGDIGAYLQPSDDPDSTDEWNYSKNRHNRMVSMKLAPVGGGSPVTVSTYHMPCAFWSPRVMSIHTALCAQHALKFAGETPLVLCGDWNFKPHDAPYKMLTGAGLPTGLETPRYNDDDDWRLGDGLSVFQSAYAVANGTEPDFTNYAQTRDDPVFIETLDYLFLSPLIKVASVIPLPSKGSVPGPFPTEPEPSDHMLIGATVDIPST